MEKGYRDAVGILASLNLGCLELDDKEDGKGGEVDEEGEEEKEDTAHRHGAWTRRTDAAHGHGGGGGLGRTIGRF